MRRRDALKLPAFLIHPGEMVIRAQTRRPKRVVIAGGGIGGLCCGYELMKRGHDVTVLEASDRTGGHVRTVRTGPADGLYVDGGAEHFTQPGYELYWGYVREFGLTALPYPRRDHMLRRIDGRLYKEEELADPAVLRKFGFNAREVAYLARRAWGELPNLYFGAYLDAFADEYKPFDAGVNHLDDITVTDLLKKDGASAGRFGSSETHSIRRSTPSGMRRFSRSAASRSGRQRSSGSKAETRSFPMRSPRNWASGCAPVARSCGLKRAIPASAFTIARPGASIRWNRSTWCAPCPP